MVVMETEGWKRNVYLSPAAEVRPSPLGGLGVFAKEDIPEDKIILRIPKSSALSVKNCGIKDTLNNHNYLEDSTRLIAAYLYERARGQSSPWHYFIEFVENEPAPDSPVLWSERERRLIDGSNYFVWEVAEMEADMEREFEESQELFSELEVLCKHKITLAQYREAALKVSSRAFEVDNYHGLAFVPGACLFNHSDCESVHFETDGDVCAQCGGVGCACPPESDWDEGSDDEDSDMQSLSEDSESGDDIASGVDEEKPTVAARETNELSHQAPNQKEDAVCEVRLTRPIKQGEEIFNTYGEHPNGVLLAKYGFALWNNAHDIVDFDGEIEDYIALVQKQEEFEQWTAKQDERMESGEADDEQFFVGVINANPPRLSPGLKTLASSIHIDARDVAKSLSQMRYSKYALEGTSERLKQLALEEKNGRKRSALTAIGTEKLLLESFSN